jgi:hypothetical protein
MEQVLNRETLREAFARAARGKRTKRDAIAFAARLDENLAELARDLAEGTYVVGPYHQFKIFDPKRALDHGAMLPRPGLAPRLDLGLRACV